MKFQAWCEKASSSLCIAVFSFSISSWRVFSMYAFHGGAGPRCDFKADSDAYISVAGLASCTARCNVISSPRIKIMTNIDSSVVWMCWQ